MSLMKPAVPEGFATIRTRGLTRSTSRAEQLAANCRRNSTSTSGSSASADSAAPIMKPTSSGPLYDGNGGGNLAYKSSSATLICVPPPVPPRISSELSTVKNGKENSGGVPFREDDDVFCTSTLTYETFKPLKSPTLKEDTCDYVSLMQSSECIDRLNYDFELPSLKSPQYITELKLIQSKAMDSGTIFTRPESPPYGKIRNSYRSSTPESVDNCSSGSSTYSNSINSGKNSSLSGYIGQDEVAKPLLNGKALTLQYRKSYSNSRSEIIYEEPKKLLGNNGSHSSDTDSGYDGASHRSSSYSKMHKSAELLNELEAPGRPQFTRGYSTMGHPRDVRIGETGYPSGKVPTVGESKSTSSLNEAHLAASKTEQPLLDHKVGSQTTLRSKPIIPWYELAIRKDHRQSCPAPLQAHVVAAFEQSLVNVSQKLQKLTVTTEQKDNEIHEMKQTIELLRQQSAGIAATQLLALSASHGTTTSGTAQSVSQTVPPPPFHGEMKRHHSSDSMYSISSSSTSCSAPDKAPKKKSGIRHSLTRAFSRNQKGPKQSRSVSLSSNPDTDPILPGYSSREEICISPTITSYVPPLSPTKISPPMSASPVQNGDPPIAYDRDGNPIVKHLVQELRNKDMVLTDIRLEALTTASQVESLKETVLKMRQEMMHLKQNNDRLQQIVTRRSITGSDISLGGGGSISPTSSSGESVRRFSTAVDFLPGPGRPMLDLPLNLDEGEEDNIPPAPAPEPPPEPLSPAFIADMSPSIERPVLADDDEIISIAHDAMVDHIDGKKIAIAVYLGQMELFGKYLEEMNEHGHRDNGKIKQNEFTIAFTYVSAKTSWQSLDYIVRRSFRDFLERVDPAGNLGLSTESIASYYLGDSKRSYEIHLPELLPYGYVVGNVDTLYICLRGVSNIALDNLIIKNMVLRYRTSAVVDPKRMAAARGSMESIDN